MKILDQDISQECEMVYNQLQKEIKSSITLQKSKNKQNSVKKNPYGGYIISIDTQLPQDYFEEMVLHEHIHILQWQEGYRDITSQTNHIVEYINDAIMDIDVNRRLKDIYHFRIGTSRRTILISKLFTIIMSHIFTKIDDNTSKIIYVSLAILSICYNDENEQRIIEIMNGKNENFISYYSSFKNILINQSGFTAKEFRLMQDKIIECLNLGFCTFQ